MTRERAIQILKMNEQEKWRSGITAEEEKEAFDMAIKALKEETICPILSDDEVKQPCIKSPCGIERPHGEWIPIKFRPMTEEEVKEQEEKWDCTLADNEKIMFDCPLPVDGQDILISKSWGVSLDTCTYDPDEGYGLEMNGDWDGVSAWMPLPEKYEEREAI